MAEVKVLLEGFTNADCRKNDEEEKTQCTTALIKDDDLIIVSDPGVLDSLQILIDALAKENLKPENVTHVFLTHSHIDHYYNVGLFQKAKVLEYFGLWDKGRCDNRPKKLNENIEIVETPGHSIDGLTMLVKTEKRVIAVAGDLWWSERGPEIDPFATDMEELNQSRKNILELADFIIPGHGGMFKNNLDLLN